jgi:glucosamine-6-phosphate deaminase
MQQPVRTFTSDSLNVRVFENEKEMGMAAASHAGSHIQRAISEKGYASLILATGTSQFSFLEALKQENIDWKRVTVFHLDEYIGISPDHPASFRRYLKERILDEISPGRVHLINADAADLQREMARYSKLLEENPVDVACIGIGENGHIAFNDPPVADFNDPLLVKAVELDHECRMQQLGEGWFPSLDAVPRMAVTLTIPAIMRSGAISCVVPGERKLNAVGNTLTGEIGEKCPATILRNHHDATLFLDSYSAPPEDH